MRKNCAFSAPCCRHRVFNNTVSARQSTTTMAKRKAPNADASLACLALNRRMHAGRLDGRRETVWLPGVWCGVVPVQRRLTRCGGCAGVHRRRRTQDYWGHHFYGDVWEDTEELVLPAPTMSRLELIRTDIFSGMGKEVLSFRYAQRVRPAPPQLPPVTAPRLAHTHAQQSLRGVAGGRVAQHVGQQVTAQAASGGECLRQRMFCGLH